MSSKLRSKHTQAISKRLFDVLVSGTALLMLAPLFLVIALVTKFQGPGPIFFRQARNGLQGSTFSILKFRSMRHAPLQLFAQATKDDARVTKLGALMRKTSIDELPQLINVLLGHMSIVGPRPHPIELDAAFTELLPDFMRRYDVKPGMTGLAQIKGLRGPTQTVEIMNSRLLADLEYVDIWSITKDIQIIFATVPAVLFPTNAH